MNNLTTHITRWQDDSEKLMPIRLEVFVREQGVPLALEKDEHDEDATHFLVTTSNHLNIATARLLSGGHIGRMAVLAEYRNQGIGKSILKSIIEFAQKSNLDKLYLNAQVTAIPFYEKSGFITEGNEFLDAGIPHKKMTLTL